MSLARPVLMLCYYFPPLGTSGTYRSLQFARRLPQFGWRPQVLSVAEAREPWASRDVPIPPEIAIQRAPEWNLHGKVMFLNGVTSRLWELCGREWTTNYWQELLCIPDPQIAWRVVSAGTRLAAGADCIYASCSPFSAALKGLAIKGRSGKPLVLDFRDPWTLNPHHRHSRLHSVLARRMERRAILGADRVIFNTEGTTRLYRQRYPEAAERMRTLPNGYDQLNEARPEELPRDRFVIMHVGSFYGTRSPDLLLQALAELRDPALEFVQIGGAFAGQERFRSAVTMRVSGPLPREEALRQMRTANLLYLRQGREAGVEDYVSVAAKTYEYLATGLPVLADCPPGDNLQLVRRYAARHYCVAEPSVEQLKAAVCRAREEGPAYRPRVLPEFAAAFDRDALTKRLAEILNEACDDVRTTRRGPAETDA